MAPPESLAVHRPEIRPPTSLAPEKSPAHLQRTASIAPMRLSANSPALSKNSGVYFAENHQSWLKLATNRQSLA